MHPPLGPFSRHLRARRRPAGRRALRADRSLHKPSGRNASTMKLRSLAVCLLAAAFVPGSFVVAQESAIAGAGAYVPTRIALKARQDSWIEARAHGQVIMARLIKAGDT